MSRTVSQSDDFEKAICIFACMRARDAIESLRDDEVFEGTEVGEEVVVLIDKAEVFAADEGSFAFCESCDIASVEEDAPAVAFVEESCDMEEGAFTAAGGSDEGGHFARHEFQVDS